MQSFRISLKHKDSLYKNFNFKLINYSYLKEGDIISDKPSTIAEIDSKKSATEITTDHLRDQTADLIGE